MFTEQKFCDGFLLHPVGSLRSFFRESVHSMGLLGNKCDSQGSRFSGVAVSSWRNPLLSENFDGSPWTSRSSVSMGMGGQFPNSCLPRLTDVCCDKFCSICKQGEGVLGVDNNLVIQSNST